MKARDFLIGFAAGVLVVTGIQATGRILDSKKVVSCSQPFDRSGVMVKIGEFRLANAKKNFINDQRLTEYAQLRAEELAANGHVSHDTKYGSFYDWLGVKSQFNHVGEEITGPINDACLTETAFANSPTHSDAILDENNTSMGVGVSGSFVVLILGNPK